MLCALILAGGSGKRFWPLSTEEKPKQLLKLFSDKTMVRETVDRVLPLIPVENIFVATNIKHYQAVKAELPMIPENNIIVEPMIRDTAAAIGYSSIIIRRERQTATLLVLPSDHKIKDMDTFLKAVSLANEEALKNHNLVTFGIVPTRPDTGYGYIKLKSIENLELMSVMDIEQFMEKPTLELAKGYLDEGDYMWNSGMFVFEIATILDEIQQHLPKHYRVIKNLQFYVDHDYYGPRLADKCSLIFEDFNKVSIDYGIMEKTKNIKVVPIEVGWNDIGAFTAFEDIYEPDEKGNIVQDSNFYSFESKGNIVLSENLEIRAIGMEDMVIVQTGNKLLICSKHEMDKMKEIM